MEVYAQNRENQLFGRRGEKPLNRPVKPFQVNSENALPGKSKSLRKSKRRALGDISNDGIRNGGTTSLKPARPVLSNISNAKKAPKVQKEKITVHAAKPFQIDADTVETRDRQSAQENAVLDKEIDIDQLLMMPVLEEDETLLQAPATLALEPVHLGNEELRKELTEDSLDDLGGLDLGPGPNDLVIDDLLLNTEFSFN